MATPDVTIGIGTAAGSPPDNSDIGQSFAALATQRGSVLRPVLAQSMNDYAIFAGARQSSSVAYDWADGFFSEKGKKLWISRKASASAAQGTLNLVDSGAGVSLVVKAGYLGDPDPGTWANGAAGGLSVAVVVASGAFQLQTSLNGVLVESSPYFSTQADAIGWAALNSRYIVLSLGATTLIPAAAAGAPLASGTDGAGLTSSDLQAAMDRISGEYGPGQVQAPGHTDATSQLIVLAHAQQKVRFALLDGLDTPTATSLITQAAGLYGAPNQARRWGQLFGPWDLAPGLTTYTQRAIPPTAAQAAAYARVSALGNPNQAAAGNNGKRLWVQDFTQPNWIVSDRGLLNAAGVTVSRRRFGGVLMTYGMRTLADQQVDRDWSMAPNVRAIMWFAHQARQIGEAHNFDQVDPFGHEIAAFKGDLLGPAATLFKAGALWCPTGNIADAIKVDVGPAANPTSQLAQGIVAANIELRLSPTPEAMQIQLIKTPLTQAI